MLGLQDWQIRVVDGLRPDQMSAPDADGFVDYETSTRTARIEILDPQYYGDRVRPYDYELILVHELLHCKFGLLDDSGNDTHDRVLHQLVDDMARTLVSAWRDGKQ